MRDSINYASRIQQAHLPSKQAFVENISEHFILYKPKDFVSGDFYYLKKNDNQIVVAAADCIDHGVPGAFVGMHGIVFLNEIIVKYNMTWVAQIPEQLRSMIKDALHQTHDTNATKDGMDIALCLIDTKNMKLQYAGAHNPLYIIRNKELIEVKATQNPIGIYIKEKTFANNEIDIQEDDAFYMFSDGYVFQFGGPDDRKFLTMNFKALLVELADKPLSKQKKTVLDNEMEQWNGTKR